MSIFKTTSYIVSHHRIMRGLCPMSYPVSNARSVGAKHNAQSLWLMEIRSYSTLDVGYLYKITNLN